jgi:hypothetical protein
MCYRGRRSPLTDSSALGLFDNGRRTDASPARESESSFEFLNRVDSEVFERVRLTLEEWFASWPPEQRGDLRGRFRTGDSGSFLGAFWELYLHEVFRRQAFEIEVHPTITGSALRPDFLLKRTDGCFYVEAKAVVMTGAQRSAERLEAAIIDTLNRLRSPAYTLEVEILGRGLRAPAIARHLRPIEDWLRGLEPSEVRERMNRWLENWWSDEEDGLYSYEINDSGWRIQLKPIAESPDLPAITEARPIGVLIPFDDGGAIDDISPIRRGLKRKTKYGMLDHPLVLGVLVDSPFVSNGDVESALFGTLAVQYTQRLKAEDVSWSRWVRRGDGFFRSVTGPRNKEVSAVLVAFKLRPWTVASAEYGGLKLWHHPWASNPFRHEVPFASAVLASDPPMSVSRRTGPTVLD